MEKKKYRHLVESASEGLFTANATGDFILVNDVASKITGYATEALIGMSFVDLVRPDYRNHVIKFYSDQFENEDVFSQLTFPIVTKQGVDRWVNQSVRLEYDKSHNVIKAVQGTVRDVTAEVISKQKAETANRLLKELNFAITTSSIVGRTDINGEVIYVNQLFCEISGYYEWEIIGKNYSIVNSGVHTANFWRKLLSTIQKGKYWRGEICHKNKAGKHYWVDTVIVPLLDEKRKPREYLSISWDITKRKEFEDALIESEERFREIFEGTSDMIQSQDYNGNIKYVNTSWKEKMGYSDEEIKNLNIWDIIHPESIKSCQEKLYKLNNKIVNSVKVDTDFVTKNKEVISVSGNVISSNKEENILSRAIFHDVTELKRTLKKEKELGELRSKFVSTASHQFRTPLTVIQSNIELLEFLIDGVGDEMQQRFSKIFVRLQQEVKRMTTMMNDILILGKIDSKITQNETKKVNLVTLCQDIVQQHNSIQTDGRRIEMQYDNDEIIARVDDKQVSHAIVNLVSNAFKYSRECANPELILEQRVDASVLIIKDYGIGIPDEDFPGLFKPFFRSKNVKDIEGTGLGLSIVKEYIELNNGEVEVVSEENKGTTFTIRFPLK